MSDLGNKEIMAKNIKYYMDLHNLERKDLCNALGFKYSTVTDWLNAEKYPRIDKIEMMANYFHISKADLVESRDKKELPAQSTLMQPSKHGVRIPVLGKVVAGIPIDAIEDIIDYEEITPELVARGKYFALQVKGESMMPTLRDGDVVIIREQPTVENGEIAIILVNGNEATVKEVKESTAGVTLIGHNVAVYSPTFYSNTQIEELPVRILGKVVEMRRKF